MLSDTTEEDFVEERISALELIHTFVELVLRYPDLKEWSNDRVASNPPWGVRLRRLQALFRAFGIKPNPAEFAAGTFAEAAPERYGAFLARAALAVPASFRRGTRPDSFHLSGCFRILLEYRVQLEATLNSTSGILEASGLYGFACVTVAKANEAIRPEAESIDALLAELVGPEGRSFTVEEMVKRYGYPTEDPDELDEEWW